MRKYCDISGKVITAVCQKDDNVKERRVRVDSLIVIEGRHNRSVYLSQGVTQDFTRGISVPCIIQEKQVDEDVKLEIIAMGDREVGRWKKNTITLSQRN